MIPWKLIERVPAAKGQGELSLHQRGDEYSIRVDGQELMNSRRHGSEEAMADLACAALGDTRQPRVMVGGLGMGFTLAAAARCLPADASIEVVELSEAVIDWNRGPLGPLAGHPLSDPRVQAIVGDVREIIERARGRYAAILLDVDNGPAALTQPANAWMYGRDGLTRITAALQSGGVLSIWSAGPDASFTRGLRATGLDASEHRVPARGAAGGTKHTIWIAVHR